MVSEGKAGEPERGWEEECSRQQGELSAEALQQWGTEGNQVLEGMKGRKSEMRLDTSAGAGPCRVLQTTLTIWSLSSGPWRVF